jgi:hypothetical protein
MYEHICGVYAAGFVPTEWIWEQKCAKGEMTIDR